MLTFLPSDALSQSAPEVIRIGKVTLSGSWRVRLEMWDWFDTKAADSSYSFVGSLLRFGLGQTGAKLDWQVEGAFPLLLGLPDNAIAPAPQGQLGLGASYFAANGRQDGSLFLKQAFVRFKGLGGKTTNTFRLGRFEFSDGMEVTPKDATLAALKRDRVAYRLVGNFAFSHVGRSLDGIHLAWNSGDANFTVVAGRPTQGAFQLNGMKEMDVDLAYAAVTRPIPQGEIRGFFLHYHDGRGALKTDNRPGSVRAADLQNIRIYNWGGHYLGNFKAGPGTLDLIGWGVLQNGHWGWQRHRAAGAAVEAGYQFGKATLKPWFRTGFLRSTGDGNAADSSHNTYFQVLPTPRLYARFPFFNMMNNQDVFFQVTLRPTGKLTLRSDVHTLRLSNREDLWYVGGGAFQNGTFGFVGRPAAKNRSLANLLDLSADYQYSAKWSFVVYLAGAWGKSVISSIYPQGSTARYAYLEFTRRF